MNQPSQFSQSHGCCYVISKAGGVRAAARVVLGHAVTKTAWQVVINGDCNPIASCTISEGFFPLDVKKCQEEKKKKEYR